MNRDKLPGIAFALSVVLVVFIYCLPACAQEKKNLRIVFVSLSWNNQLFFRVAINKGFFLKRNSLDPDKDVLLRAIGTTVVRAGALARGAIAAAPFTAEDSRPRPREAI
jgi:hypothetical protein